MDTVVQSLRSLFYTVRQHVRGEVMDLESLLANPKAEVTWFDELGKQDAEAVLALMRARGFVFSYRKGFSPALEGGYTTDQGWGCMLRVMQMVLTQALVMADKAKVTGGDPEWIRAFMRLFADNSSEKSPLGVRAFCDLYKEKFGKPHGSWFGPTSAAKVAAMLGKKASAASSPIKVPRLQVFDDGAIFEDELLAGSGSASSLIWPCLALVCRTVGAQQIKGDPDFQKGLSSLFEARFHRGAFVAIAAGDSGVSAHCFIGKMEENQIINLIHWDPHLQLLQALDPEKQEKQEEEEPLSSAEGRLLLVRKSLGKLRVDQMNPSFCVALLIKDAAHWKQVKEGLSDRESKIPEVLEILAQNPINMMMSAEAPSLDMDEEDFYR